MTVDEGIEDVLRILAIIAHLCLIGQPVAFLGERQSDGVDASRVVDERVEVHLPVDTCHGRRLDVGIEILEVDVLRAQQVGDGVVTAALHVQFHRGQQSLEGRLVYHLVLILRRDGVYQRRQLLEQRFVAAGSVQLHDEVAALYTGQRGVAVGAQQHAQVLRVVGLRGVGQHQVTQPSLHLVAVFQVGVDRQLAVHAYRQRGVPEFQAEEVHLLQVGRQRGLHAVAAEQGVDAYLAVEQVVMSRQRAHGTSVAQRHVGGHVGGVGQPLVAVLQEVAQVHVVHLDIGGVRADVLRLSRRHQCLHRSPTLAQRQVGVIALTVGLHLSRQRHVLGQTDAVGQHRLHKSQVLRLGLHVHLSAQLLGVGHVVGHAVSLQVQGRGQVDVEPRKLHALHVAVHRALDRKRLVGIIADELLGHVACQSHQVLLAYLGIQPDAHLSSLLSPLSDTGVISLLSPLSSLLFKRRKVHAHLGLDVAVGRPQHDVGHLHMTEGRV